MHSATKERGLLASKAEVNQIEQTQHPQSIVSPSKTPSQRATDVSHYQLFRSYKNSFSANAQIIPSNIHHSLSSNSSCSNQSISPSLATSGITSNNLPRSTDSFMKSCKTTTTSHIQQPALLSLSSSSSEISTLNTNLTHTRNQIELINKNGSLNRPRILGGGELIPTNGQQQTPLKKQKNLQNPKENQQLHHSDACIRSEHLKLNLIDDSFLQTLRTSLPISFTPLSIDEITDLTSRCLRIQDRLLNSVHSLADLNEVASIQAQLQDQYSEWGRQGKLQVAPNKPIKRGGGTEESISDNRLFYSTLEKLQKTFSAFKQCFKVVERSITNEYLSSKLMEAIDQLMLPISSQTQREKRKKISDTFKDIHSFSSEHCSDTAQTITWVKRALEVIQSKERIDESSDLSLKAHQLSTELETQRRAVEQLTLERKNDFKSMKESESRMNLLKSKLEGKIQQFKQRHAHFILLINSLAPDINLTDVTMNSQEDFEAIKDILLSRFKVDVLTQDNHQRSVIQQQLNQLNASMRQMRQLSISTNQILMNTTILPNNTIHLNTDRSYYAGSLSPPQTVGGGGRILNESRIPLRSVSPSHPLVPPLQIHKINRSSPDRMSLSLSEESVNNQRLLSTPLLPSGRRRLNSDNDNEPQSTCRSLHKHLVDSELKHQQRQLQSDINIERLQLQFDSESIDTRSSRLYSHAPTFSISIGETRIGSCHGQSQDSTNSSKYIGPKKPPKSKKSGQVRCKTEGDAMQPLLHRSRPSEFDYPLRQELLICDEVVDEIPQDFNQVRRQAINLHSSMKDSSNIQSNLVETSLKLICRLVEKGFNAFEGGVTHDTRTSSPGVEFVKKSTVNRLVENRLREQYEDFEELNDIVKARRDLAISRSAFAEQQKLLQEEFETHVKSLLTEKQALEETMKLLIADKQKLQERVYETIEEKLVAELKVKQLANSVEGYDELRRQVEEVQREKSQLEGRLTEYTTARMLLESEVMQLKNEKCSMQKMVTNLLDSQAKGVAQWGAAMKLEDSVKSILKEHAEIMKKEITDAVKFQRNDNGPVQGEVLRDLKEELARKRLKQQSRHSATAARDASFDEWMFHAKISDNQEGKASGGAEDVLAKVKEVVKNGQKYEESFKRAVEELKELMEGMKGLHADKMNDITEGMRQLEKKVTKGVNVCKMIEEINERSQKVEESFRKAGVQQRRFDLVEGERCQLLEENRKDFEKLAELKAEVKVLQRQNEDLEKAKRCKDRETAETDQVKEEQLRKAQLRVGEAERQNLLAEEEGKRLRIITEIADDKARELTRSVEELKKLTDSLKNEVERTRGDLQRFREDSDGEKKRHQESEKHSAEALRRCQDELRKSSVEFAKIKVELAGCEESLSSAENAKGVTLQELEASKKKHAIEVNLKESEVERLKEELRQAKEVIVETERNEASKQLQMQETHKQLVEARGEMKQQLEEQAKKLAAAESEIEAAESKIIVAESKVAAAESKLAAAESKITATERKLAKAESKNIAAGVREAELAAETKGQLEELTKRLEETENKLLIVKKQATEASLTFAEEKSKLVEQHLNEKRSEVQRVEQAAQITLFESLEVAQRKAQEKQDEKEKEYQNSYEELSTALKKTRDELENRRKEVELAQTLLKDKDTMIERLVIDFNAQKQQNEIRLQTQSDIVVTELKEKIKVLEERLKDEFRQAQEKLSQHQLKLDQALQAKETDIVELASLKTAVEAKLITAERQHKAAMKEKALYSEEMVRQFETRICDQQSALDQSLASFKLQLSEKDDVSINLSITCEQLKEQCISLQRDLSEQITSSQLQRTESLKAEGETSLQLEKIHASFKELQEEFQKSKQGLEVQSQESERTIEDLKQHNCQLKEQFELSRQQVVETEEKYSEEKLCGEELGKEWLIKCAALESKLAEVRASESLLSTEINSTKAALAESCQSLAQMHSALRENRNTLTKASNDAERMDQLFTEKDAHISELQAQLVKLHQQNGQLRDQLTQQSANFLQQLETASQAAKEELKKEIARSTQDLKNVDTERRNLKDQLAEVILKHSKQLESLQNETSLIQRSLEQQLSSSQTILNNLQREHAQTNEYFSEAKAEITRQTAVIDQLDKEIQESYKRKRKLAETNEILNAQHIQLSAALQASLKTAENNRQSSSQHEITLQQNIKQLQEEGRWYFKTTSKIYQKQVKQLDKFLLLYQSLLNQLPSKKIKEYSNKHYNDIIISFKDSIQQIAASCAKLCSPYNDSIVSKKSHSDGLRDISAGSLSPFPISEKSADVTTTAGASSGVGSWKVVNVELTKSTQSINETFAKLEKFHDSIKSFFSSA